MNPRKGMNEGDEPFDPEAFLDQSFESPVPGYKVVPGKKLDNWGAVGQHVWQVVTQNNYHVGYIMYDPEDDMPPEAEAYWKGYHWIATTSWRITDTKYFKSFDEAFRWVITYPSTSEKVAEALLETDLDDPERYVQQAALLPVPGYEVEVPPGPGVFQIYAKDSQGRYGFNTSVGTIFDMTRYEDDPEQLPRWPKTPRWLAMYRYNPEDVQSFAEYNDAFAWLDTKRKADPKRKHLAVGESEEFDDDSLKDYALSTEIGAGSLRTELRKFYDHVGVDVKPATVQIYKDQKTWVVTCRRETPLPLPEKGMTGWQFKNLVISWLQRWASTNGLYLPFDTFEFYGTLRKNFTVRFETIVRGAPLDLRNESTDPDDPESFMPDFLRKANWANDIFNVLWDFHATGVSYNAGGGQQGGVVWATTYFDPAKDDFSNRFFDTVLHFFQSKNFPIKQFRMWIWPVTERQRSPYPEWVCMCVLNGETFNPTVRGEPPNRSL